MRQILIENAITAVGLVLSGLLTVLGFKWKAWVDAKIKNEAANTLLKRMMDAAADIVRDVSAVEFRTLREGLQDDGRLSADDRAKLRQAGIDRLKTYMGPAALAELAKVMNVGAEAIEVIVASKVEHAVDKMKLERVAAANATPVAPVLAS